MLFKVWITYFFFARLVVPPHSDVDHPVDHPWRRYAASFTYGPSLLNVRGAGGTPSACRRRRWRGRRRWHAPGAMHLSYASGPAALEPPAMPAAVKARTYDPFSWQSLYSQRGPCFVEMGAVSSALSTKMAGVVVVCMHNPF